MIKVGNSTEYKIIGGGEISLGTVTSICEGYRVPDISEFVDGFQYERCDGYNWFQKTYQIVEKHDKVFEYQKSDVITLLKQKRIRVC